MSELLTNDDDLHRQRLLNAARAVREGHPENFTMRHFQNYCGTPACVIGHYAARTDLQSAFILKKQRNWIYRASNRKSVHGGISDLYLLKHFGIDRAESTELFAIDGCGGAVLNEQAAQYIERWVGKKWPSIGLGFAHFAAHRSALREVGP